MDEIDLRIFDFIELLKQTRVVTSDNQFASEIGITRQKLSGIRNREDRHFTVEDIHRICKRFKGNPSYFYGFDDKKIRI